MLVGQVIRKSEVRAELLEARLALGAGAVGVRHAGDRGEGTALEFGYCGADLRDSADDFVAGYAGVDGGHHAAPLVADLVEIGVTDAAIQNFELYVVFGWIAPRDRGGGERRFLTGSGASFSVEHVLILDARQVLRYAKPAIVHSKHADMRLQSERFMRNAIITATSTYQKDLS